jgi:hypothetical protein
MTFEGQPPDLVTKLMGSSAWRIFASGEIDVDAGERFASFVAKERIPFGSDLDLHTNGGSLIGGMSLGRVIREYIFTTHVGQKGALKDEFQHIENGVCMSACAIAFLGGKHRFVSGESKYGVHRFTLNDDGVSQIDLAQQLSASVVDYIGEMGVDPKLFTIASETPSDDILVLPKETLNSLNITTNGRSRPIWTIESIEDALYLKGERETVYGMNKYLIVFPAKGSAYIHVIFDGGQNAETAMMMEADSLVFDREMVTAEELRVSRVNDYGRINATYLLTSELLVKMLRAKTVGLCLQFTSGAPIFLGFNDLPFEEGAAKLPGLLSTSHQFRDGFKNER